jgi:hypothetical protein
MDRIKKVRSSTGWLVYSPDKETTKLRLFRCMKENGETGCWEWSGGLCKDGYGQMRFDSKNVLVHRLAAWCWKNFDLDSSLKILHTCDNPPCFKPSHLFEGTDLDNKRDCIAKGRDKSGEFLRNRTRCNNGHLYDEENTKWDRRGWRVCIKCLRAQWRRKTERRSVLRKIRRMNG